MTDTITFPCLKFTQNGVDMYMFALEASQLWRILSVNERNPDKDEGYQRAFSQSRGLEVKKFIQDRKTIAPALIVSLQNMTYDESNQTITIPADSTSGWVIDGQHRLRGAQLASIDRENPIDLKLPVVAFNNLSDDDQIEQFVTINREGKGVPTSLYYDLLKRLPSRKTPAERAKEKVVEIARQLNNDIESEFYERIITIRSPKKGEISITNFVRKIYPLLLEDKGTLSEFTQAECIKILDNYFKALRSVFPDEFTAKNRRFFGTLGFGAIINSFNTVFTKTRTEYNGFTIADIVKTLNTVDHFNFSAWDQYGTGNAAENLAGEDFSAAIKNAVTSEDKQILRL